MKANYQLFKGLIIKDFIITKRYLFNTVISMVSMLLIFSLLFFGAKSLSGSGDLKSIVANFAIFILYISSFQSTAQNITDEVKKGTYEQLYMSNHSMSKILIFQIIIDSIIGLVFFFIFVYAAMLISGNYLSINILEFIPLAYLSVLGIIGVALFVGGLTIVFKNISGFLQLLQFAIIGIVALPYKGIYKLLPGNLGTKLMNRVLIDGVSFMELSSSEYIELFLSGLVYFIAGLLFYKLFENIARKKGVLGHY